MKQTAYWTVMLLSMLLLFSCKQGERIIENPAFGAMNSTTLEIKKIVLNDTATILYMDATYRPKYWIRIDSNGYLQADGKKYKILRGEGIKLSDYHWMPESGKSSFQLIFPPLPRSVKRMDYIEADNCERAFNFWDIELQQGAKPFSPDLPKELSNLPVSTAERLAEAELKTGKTTLNVRLLNFKEGMDKNPVQIYINELLTGGQKEYEHMPDSTQTSRFEFNQYGTQEVAIVHNSKACLIVLSPGEEVNVWLDLGAWSKHGTPHHDTDPRPVGYVTNGKYMALNNSLIRKSESHEQFSGLTDSILSISPEAYIGKTLHAYHRTLDTLANDSQMSGELKDYLKIKHQDAALNYIFDYEYECERAYRQANNVSWEVREIDYHAPKITPEMLGCLKELGVNDLSKLYSTNFPFQQYGIFTSFPTPEKLEKMLGTDKGLLFDLQKIKGVAHKIENLESLTEEEQARITSIPDKFYTEAFAQMDQEMQAKLEAAKHKKGWVIRDVPNADNAKLFDAVMSRYKGKVVLVDYWATWCGPCREAMKMTEPLKDELEDEDIVYVYFTGESSPQGRWLEMIPDIKGEHYRFSQKQWDVLCDKFNIQGIPAYVVVDKKGKPTVREDFPNVNLMKKVLIEESKK